MAGTIVRTHIARGLDLAYDEPALDLALTRIEAAHGVYVRVVTEVGPAGGWPVVDVIGSYDDVRLALGLTWGFDGDGVGYDGWEADWITAVD